MGRIMGQVRRRQFLIAAGALFAAPLASFAQPQPAKPARIGVLATLSASTFANRVEALRAGLRELGYVEGRNIVIELRSAEKFDRVPELAAELVRLKVDVLVAGGTPAIRAARQATEAIPIVIAAVGDAVAGGLVASLARPGGNVTGSTYFAPELAAKQLGLLKEAFPTAGRIAAVANPDNRAMASTMQSVETAAGSLKIDLERFEVRDLSELDGAFAAMAKKRIDAALIIDDPMIISNARAVAEFAARHRLPTAGFIEYGEAGGLIAYGVNLNEMWRRAGFFVDRILRGAKPTDIPVERATKFDLVINRITAKAIGVTIPQSILLRADRVIE